MAPASLGPSSHQRLEDRAGTRSWNGDLSPSLPFAASPFGTWSCPGSPGPSVVVLFPTACSSSGPSCVVSPWGRYFSGDLHLHGTVPSFFHSSWLGSLEVLSLEVLPLGVWSMDSLVFQRPGPPCSAKVPPQMTCPLRGPGLVA